MSGERSSVPVSALKASLSRYLRRVKAGEEVIVTERDRPVAKIVPITSPAGTPEHLRRLEREGRIRLGSGRLPRDFWKRPRPDDPNGLLARAVEEEREEGR